MQKYHNTSRFYDLLVSAEPYSNKMYSFPGSQRFVLSTAENPPHKQLKRTDRLPHLRHHLHTGKTDEEYFHWQS